MASPRTVLCCALLVASACADDGGDAGPSETPAPVNTVDPTATTTPPSSTPTTTIVATAPTPAATDATSPPVHASTSSSTTTSSSTSTTTTSTTLPPAPPPANETFDDLRLELELVADVEHPTAVVWRGGDPAMYVGTQDGLVLRVDEGGAQTEVLDLTDETSPFAPGSERGLLGVAFDPRSDRLYVNHTDLDNDTRVASYAMVGDVADPSSRVELLFIDQPGLGHNGGRLLFDAAGNLYIGSGDGGGSNGRDAEDTAKLFGAILRVLPTLDGATYAIPPDNPHADGVADRPEVWARGFRNPWTFSLDRATGDLWIGDVGNDEREEIDVLRAGQQGANFGWPWYEGNHQRRSNPPDGLTPPVYDYPRSVGVAVMGGHVYRGSAIPQLQGAFLFGDLGGPLWAIGAQGVSRLDVDPVRTLVGWGEDPSGELYVLSLTDGVFRLVPG